MPTPPVPQAERARRKEFMELLVAEGYAPLGAPKGEMGSAAQEGKRRDGVNYARWIRDEQKLRSLGQASYIPNWIGACDDEYELTPIAREMTALDHAETRAELLSSELTALLTNSNYPVTNPEAVVVDSYTTRRFDRKSGDYRSIEGTPRTWLSDTLRVSPTKDVRGRRFIFTGAQNDAPVHGAFWTNLKVYAAYLGADVVVGPYTYQTQWWSENNPTSRSYARELEPHLCFGQMALGEGFVFCGEMNIIPTASQPISDLVTYSRNKWAVFGHPKRQLKSVPSTDPSIPAHHVMTSGSVTVPKVIPRKAGIKGVFHHVIGAVIVEFDEHSNIFCRHITGNRDGHFYDLDRLVKDGKVSTGHGVTALVCGDVHLRKLDETNALATFGFSHLNDKTRSDNILSVLNPKYVMLHDIFDNESRNHHNCGDNLHSYEMAIRGRESVFDEVYDVGSFLDRLKNSTANIVVVESNHDLGLARYVKEGRYRNDGINIRFGLQLEDALLANRERVAGALDSGQTPASFSLLEHAVRMTNEGLDHVTWVHDGKSFLIDGIECGHHGFRGANGARGTVTGFARMGRKMSIGDKHSAEINEGVYVAGVMQLQQGYNIGPSGWTTSHIVQYADGSRSLITLQNGRWRAEKPKVRVKAA